MKNNNITTNEKMNVNEDKEVEKNDNVDDIFNNIDKISTSQSAALSERGRHVFYALFATNWASLWLKNEDFSDLTGAILLIVSLCIGVVYLILDIGRYYVITRTARRILSEMQINRDCGQEAIIRMNIASDNAFVVVKIEMALLCLMGVLNIIYYVRKLFDMFVLNI